MHAVLVLMELDMYKCTQPVEDRADNKQAKNLNIMFPVYFITRTTPDTSKFTEQKSDMTKTVRILTKENQSLNKHQTFPWKTVSDLSSLDDNLKPKM